MVVTLCKTSLAGGAAEKPLDSTRCWLGPFVVVMVTSVGLRAGPPLEWPAPGRISSSGFWGLVCHRPNCQYIQPSILWPGTYVGRWIKTGINMWIGGASFEFFSHWRDEYPQLPPATSVDEMRLCYRWLMGGLSSVLNLSRLCKYWLKQCWTLIDEPALDSIASADLHRP